jgi:Skp family chaperone for outer membrane proteins
MGRKTMRFCLAMALMIGVVAAETAAAEFYKYIDKQGHVRFTDDINQVPENQRSRVRNYVDSQVPLPPASASGESAKQTPEPISAQLEGPALAFDSSSVSKDSLEAGRSRIEEMKKKLEADYQALLKEKEALSKEKETRKTRDEISAFNKRVEAFNQLAARYENKSDELRKMADEYNARIMEENSKIPKSLKKSASP